MSTYRYTGFNAAGQPARGLLQANSPKEARECALRDGILVRDLRAVGGAGRAPGAPERAGLYRELAGYLGSGLTVPQALDVLAAAAGMERAARVEAIRDRIKEGAGLAAALDPEGSRLDPFERTVLQAADRSGNIGAALERLARALETRESLRASVGTALLYPGLIFLTGLVVGGIMLGVLLPRVRGLYAASMALPWLTRAMLGAGDLVLRWGWLLLLIVLLAGWGGRRRLRRPAVRERVERVLFGLPVIGHSRRALCRIRFAQTLSALLDGGVLLVDAFSLAGESTGSVAVTRLCEQESERLRQGGRLSQSLDRIDVLAGGLAAVVRVGEQGGGMARLLQEHAIREEQEWNRHLRGVLALLEPLLILLVGVFILLIALAVLLPIMSMQNPVSIR